MEKEMKEAIQFFADNNFPAVEMIKKGWKQSLTEGQTRAGMVRVYNRVKDGEEIKPNRLAWRAWEEGAKIQADDFMALETDKETLRSQVDSLTKHRMIVSILAGIGWITALVFIVQYFWGALWQ